MTVKIQANKSGPYVVHGEFELRGTDGQLIEHKATCALCRCGASSTKPFCDGTHSKIGFDAAASVVPSSKE
jgi:CDGSH-type Zn-finger protein